MNYHILNGDALMDQFPSNIKGQSIVARECLVDGDVQGATLNEFWLNREAFIRCQYYEKLNKTYPQGEYQRKVVEEYSKIFEIEDQSNVFLWFEDDLFCQVNLWFVSNLLTMDNKELKCHIVRPRIKDWNGFGALLSTDLYDLYENRTQLRHEHLRCLAEMWEAYQQDNLEQLTKKSMRLVEIFPYINEVVSAHNDRCQFSRPEKTLTQIKNELKTNEFAPIFKEFCIREGVYGFGDLQVLALFNKIGNDE